jgi:hypothetical protein
MQLSRIAAVLAITVGSSLVALAAVTMSDQERTDLVQGQFRYSEEASAIGGFRISPTAREVLDFFDFTFVFPIAPDEDSDVLLASDQTLIAQAPPKTARQLNADLGRGQCIDLAMKSYPDPDVAYQRTRVQVYINCMREKQLTP